MMVCFCASIFLALGYLGTSLVQNRSRDRLYGKPEKVREGTGEGLIGDLTDKQQKESFRYTH